MHKPLTSYGLRLLSIIFIVVFVLSANALGSDADKQMLLNIQQAIQAKNAKWTAAGNERSQR